jgi:multiple sugar transport system substrate-binding protein
MLLAAIGISTMNEAGMPTTRFPTAHRVSIWLVFLAMVLVAVEIVVNPASIRRANPESANAAAEKVRLVLAVNTDAKAKEIFREAIDEFTASHPDISIQLLEIPGDYYQKLLVMIAGRTAPDLMWMGEPFIEFANRDVFLDVTKNVEREVDPRQFAPEALDWYRLGGRQYGVAYGFDLRFIVYNKHLFDEAGVPYPQDQWTYADFLDKSQRLTRKDDHGRIVQYGFRGSLDMSLFGATVLSSENNCATCESSAMLDFLQTNLDLAEKYHVAPHDKQLPNEAFEDPVNVFRQGKTAMMVMATWNLAYLQQQCADIDWDVSTNPIVRRPGHWASSEAILISSETKHPKEAWLLYKTFLGANFQREMAGIIVPSNLRAAARWVDENHYKPAHISALVEATKSMQRSPQVGNLREVMRVFFDSCESVWACRSTPTVAMARAQSQINQILSESRLEEQ